MEELIKSQTRAILWNNCNSNTVFLKRFLDSENIFVESFSFPTSSNEYWINHQTYLFAINKEPLSKVSAIKADFIYVFNTYSTSDQSSKNIYWLSANHLRVSTHGDCWRPKPSNLIHLIATSDVFHFKFSSLELSYTM